MESLYDAAKTPLLRLLLSHALPTSKEQELQRMAQILDPLRLFHHLQDLQRALMGFRTSVSSAAERTASVVMLPFCIERCLGKSGHALAKTGEAARQNPLRQTGASAPVLSCQSEQEAHGEAHLLHQAEISHQRGASSQQPGKACLHVSQPVVEEQKKGCPSATTSGTAQDRTSLSHEPASPFDGAVTDQLSYAPCSGGTLTQAIQDFLEDQRRLHRRPKTLEWHAQALGLFQHYLLTEHQCILLDQITEVQVRGWFAALPQMPTALGTLRSPNTVESYARSARAFCQWLVQHHYLSSTPFAGLQLPSVENRFPLPLEPEEWEQVLLACHPPKETGAMADQAAARNRVLLWMLFETGMHATEICGLRLGDVDREQGMLQVQGKGAAVRWLTLGYEGRRHLLAYLDHYRLKGPRQVKDGDANAEPLFLTETGRPLTKGAIGLLFGRLRERVELPGKTLRVSLVRKHFAVRYLQTGGDLDTLQELLGQQGSLSWQQAQLRCDHVTDDQRGE